MKMKKKKEKEMRVKKRLLLVILVILAGSFFGFSEIIEKIYAVVNGELITYSELKIAEMEFSRALAQKYQGEELAQQIAEMKKNLLDQLVEQKIIVSFAKEKNYDVDGEVELLIKDVKKQNNINTDEELKQALASQGIDFEEWKKQIKENRIQYRFISEKIGSKIKIDSSAIMGYYRDNIKDYTLPLKLTLDCVFLNKANYVGERIRKEKMSAVETELKHSSFEEVAKTYTDLPGGETHLGEFKQGELAPALEEAALKLKEGEISGWLETDNGWYILRLVKRTEPQLVEYKEVRAEIENKLAMAEQDKEIDKLLKELKKDSYIKIYENY
jgi:peptidyl-prolyl cis-trans isomerase SurA